METYRPIPFYMLYPLDHEEELERDAQYFQSMYPMNAKLIQKYIEESLQILEYEGSRIYDAFPDKIMLKMIVDDVCRRAEKIENVENKKEMIEVMLYHELWRKRHKTCGNIFKI